MLDPSDVHSSPDQWTAAHNMVGHGQCFAGQTETDERSAVYLLLIAAA